jgi:hypothetical protein
MKLSGQQSALLGATAVSVVAWFAPVLDLALRPIQYLNTHVHEFCHAVAAVATGGSAQEILVHADGSGQTPVAGGAIIVIASAGYVGAAILGALLIAYGTDEKRAKTLLLSLAGLMALSMLVWVRGDVAGILWGGFWTLVLTGLGFLLQGKAAVFAVQFVGVQQCLNALLSIVTLLQISLVTQGPSDAMLMEKYSGVPAIAWAGIWSLMGVCAIVLALREAWR